MKKFILSLIVLSVFSFSMITSGQYFDDEYDVPFVPTKYKIVEKMLTMANVNKKDILYDLGCGDGRIVITAAKKYGCRGVGIDINPVRIEESNENALQEGVTDKVQFIEQNLFDADISEATVLTMYLLTSVNLQLRPKLFHDLKPGTRLVSHDFDMGGWKPDKSTVVEMDDDALNSSENHTVYFWILPANVSGDWEVIVSDKDYNKTIRLHIDQNFQILQGNITNDSTMIFTGITIEGDRIHFTVEDESGKEIVMMKYDGTVKDNTIVGKVALKSGILSTDSFWEAKRNPSSVIPLDESQ